MIRNLRRQLESRTISARQLVEESLERITAPEGQGGTAFLSVADEDARQVAGFYDAVRATGRSLAPYAGIPIAVKDLCDIAGQVTTAGSMVLSESEPAVLDAPAVARLRAAGFIVLGRTNMTEFAYSGLGINSHYGTPSSPWNRKVEPRVPGGSSSGTAVAVADEMTVAGLGTDTGGSCRIPAAFCGIVGYKPTARRIPLDGLFPLAPSLDSVGPLGRSVDCCAIVDHVFAGGTGVIPETSRPAAQIRLAAISDYVVDGLDAEVAENYTRALQQLSAAGIKIVEIPFPELHHLPEINRNGGLVVAEAFATHSQLLAESSEEYDHLVRIRLEPGSKISAAEYIEILNRRAEMIATSERRLGGFDAFVLPTVAVIAPTIDSFDSGDVDYYSAMNSKCLRNTSVGNFLDSCAISLPIHKLGGAPVGLMLMGRPMQDADLFEVSRTVEAVIDRART